MGKFQEMSSFVAVAEAGSFVAAAELTGMSKAAVSRHVAELEERLGVRLMQRTTRRLSLTDDGLRFLARCKELLASIDEAESELSSSTGNPSGLIRVNAPLTFGVIHLAPLWGRFMDRYPKVTLDVTLGDRIVDLVEEGYDLAIRISNLPSSALVSRTLASTRMVLCASPQYLRVHGTPTHPSELAACRIISFSYWVTRDEWHFMGPEGEVIVRIKSGMHTNNGDTCRFAALDHQGIILQPDFIIEGDLRAGTLVELMPDYRAISLGIHAVYPSRKHLPLKVRRLIDFLVDAFALPSWTHQVNLPAESVRSADSRRKAGKAGKRA
jgi:DNA-binding transcriptional LysR family regulator